ncbi:MAG: pyrroline-5-carboxylate reductase [Pseudomonadota bacterium]
MRILMLGCGKMGGALLARWCAATPFQFTALSPSGRRSLPEGVPMVRSAHDLGDDVFDAAVLAVKPQMVKEVLPQYVRFLGADAPLLSIVAGSSCATLAAYAPNAPLIRIMPNLPAAIGLGVSGVFAPAETDAAHLALVDTLMKPTGRILRCASEDELDRITAIAGSGPGFAFEIMRAWSDATEELGMDGDTSREWILEMLRGAVALALQRGEPLDELRQEVTSKNGTTAAGLTALNGDKEIDSRLRAMLGAAYGRAVELREL